ncbi:MAG: hypothetical protein HFF90_07755 [Oscillibacter sp.]|nr:hypothetical protein [Oscillibacter sp.]
MDYQEFKKLYCEDPVVFHLGMELFDAKGKDSIFSSTDQMLYAAVREKLSALLSENRLMDVVKAAKDFARLSAVERLAYAARCGVILEDGPVDEPGIRPLCGGGLEYLVEDGTGLFIRDWRCKECGAIGKEGWRKVFDCHYNVWDGEKRMVNRQKLNK